MRPRRIALASLASVACVTCASTEARAWTPDQGCARPSTAMFELAPWAALGGGVRATDGERVRGIGNVSLHAAATVPVARLVRAGAWFSPGTSDFASFDASAGGRVELHSNDADDEHVRLFGVGGRWTVLGDLGVGHRAGPKGNEGAFWVARVALGFTARNRLYNLYGAAPCHCDRDDPNASEEPVCRPQVGLVSGARPFVALQRDFDGTRTEVTAGIEFELIGAGWWIGAGL